MSVPNPGANGESGTRLRALHDPLNCPHRQSEMVPTCLTTERERCLDCGQWL